MEHYETLITELSGLAGIIPEYYDIFGRKHVTSKESEKAILSAMGFNTGTAEEVAREIERKKNQQWHAVLDPVTIIPVHSRPHFLALHLPLPRGREQEAAFTLILEDEQEKRETFHFPPGSLEVDEERTIADRRFVRVLLPLPHREIGYYRATAACSHPDPVFEGNARSLARSARLIVAPDACYMPEQLQDGRTWGVAANLYALRSERNWGIGDFGDLRSMVAWAAGLQAGLVGINPLHAIPNTSPFGISPYSPISRLYRNFLYIDMDSVPELSRIPRSAQAAETIAALRKSDRIDYCGVAALKKELLEQAFELFHHEHYQNETGRGKAFREYLLAEGAPLEEFSLFCALAEQMKERHQAPSWREWPEEYRSPESPAVEAFKTNNDKRVLFFAYLQWLIECQMAAAAEAASSGGMSVGVYGDLAIGAIAGGSDGWTYQEVLAEDVSVGVPPDDFNHNGQDWGFPPMIPDKLRESGYELFIRTIRKNMQHMGALRIDHALGLFRLFWIPRGRPAAEGAFVRCNAEDLLRIIALESVRNRTLVVGEDLGTITDEARQALQRFGILSYRLFYFERNYPDPSFLSPECYPAMALSAVTTHDLPTLPGWWTGRDLEVKRQLGIISDDEHYGQQKSGRERDRKLLLEALQRHGILPAGAPAEPAQIPAMTPALCAAVYRYLSISPTKIALVSFDDVIGMLDQQNVPGTVSEHPNWMQKTPLSLEELAADPRWKELAEMFRETRGRERG